MIRTGEGRGGEEQKTSKKHRRKKEKSNQQPAPLSQGWERGEKGQLKKHVPAGGEKNKPGKNQSKELDVTRAKGKKRGTHPKCHQVLRGKMSGKDGKNCQAPTLHLERT